MKRKGPIKYFIGQIVQELFLAARGLIIPNFLGPYQYGLVSALNIIERYSNFTNLGIHQNILYKVPYYRVRNDTGRIEEVKNISFSFTLLTGVLTTLFIVCVALLKSMKMDRHLFLGMLIMSLSPLLLTVRGVFMLSLRADKNFEMISKVLILSSVCLFALVLTLGLLFGAIGVISAQIVTSIIAVVFLIRTSGLRFRFNINIRKVAEFLKFSIPIVFVIESLKAFLATIDKIVILKYLGTISVGFYSIGLGLSSLVFIVPASIATVSNPSLVEEHGRSKKHAAEYFVNATAFITVVTAFFVVLLVLLAPWLIKTVFPKYSLGIECARMLPFLVYFEGISLIAAQLLILLNRKTHYIAILLGTLLVSYLVLNFTFVKQNINYIAVFMVLINALKAICLLLMASAAAITKKETIFGFIGFILTVSLFIVLYPVLADYFLNPYFSAAKLCNLLSAIISAIVFTFIYVLLMLCFKTYTGTIKNVAADFFVLIKNKFIPSSIPNVGS